MNGMYLSELAIIAKPFQKFKFDDTSVEFCFNEKGILCADGERCTRPFSIEELAEPNWNFVK